MFVLSHEINSNEHLLDNLGFLDEMGGDRYSDRPASVEHHGFRPLSLQTMGRLLAEYDLVIPF